MAPAHELWGAPMKDARLFTTARSLALRYGKTERTVRRWIANGTIPSVRIGGSRLIPEEGLDALQRETFVGVEPQLNEDE
jgi:excisionase family DNA binding protein